MASTPISATTALRIDEPSATITYVGEADGGSLDSDAVWRIKKITVSGAVTKVEWANGIAKYENIWDNRATYTYS
jgi:hypothetical protein